MINYVEVINNISELGFGTASQETLGQPASQVLVDSYRMFGSGGTEKKINLVKM